jgi:hypothetical protein
MQKNYCRFSISKSLFGSNQPGASVMQNNLTKSVSGRRAFLMWAGSVVAFGSGMMAFGWSGTSADAGFIRVVKNPYCGCCDNWVKYLEHAGWSADVVIREDLGPTKRDAGVPEQLESCHTAFVDGYVIEGHVPLPAIEKLLEERPDLAGIAVPGMPDDAPGMSGGGVMEVIGFKNGTPTGLYTSARG